MAKIQINAAARAAIRANTLHGRTLAETAVQVAPDLWDVEVEPITLDTLERVRVTNGLENHSDTILWLASAARGHPWGELMAARTKRDLATVRRLRALLDVKHASFAGTACIREALSSAPMRLYLESYVFPNLARLENVAPDPIRGEAIPVMPLEVERDILEGTGTGTPAGLLPDRK